MAEKKKNETLVPTDQPLAAYLDQIKAKYEQQAAGDIEDRAKESAKEVFETLTPGGKPLPEQQWLPFAPMPTDMCRVSPFFPMARQEMAARQYLENIVITQSSWGQITYTGPKLSIFEEDVLMAVLALLDSKHNRVKTKTREGTTYTYRGSLKAIMEMMALKSFSRAAYQRVFDAFKRLTGAVLHLDLNGRRHKVNSMIINADWAPDKKIFEVTVNPYFYETYMGGSVTRLHVQIRAKLPGQVTKALFRFTLSHKEDVWRGHYLTLAASLNLDLNKPPRRLRSQIKTAITELKKANILLPNSGIDQDVITLTRRPKALEPLPAETPDPKGGASKN